MTLIGALFFFFLFFFLRLVPVPEKEKEKKLLNDDSALCYVMSRALVCMFFFPLLIAIAIIASLACITD